ncbi:hypothetical protein CLAIMM_13838 [Cladophialophora immunda]|nr:hypothetical protein CLAIMM_13838 [Cladophialophora immunda]
MGESGSFDIAEYCAWQELGYTWARSIDTKFDYTEVYGFKEENMSPTDYVALIQGSLSDPETATQHLLASSKVRKLSATTATVEYQIRAAHMRITKNPRKEVAKGHAHGILQFFYRKLDTGWKISGMRATTVKITGARSEFSPPRVWRGLRVAVSLKCYKMPLHEDPEFIYWTKDGKHNFLPSHNILLEDKVYVIVMAAPDIQLSPSEYGVQHITDLDAPSAQKVTALLKENHEKFHTYWNFKGYHNHQTHYLLTAYALGASPDKLQNAFDTNAHYQRPLARADEQRVQKLYDDDYFLSLMSNEDYYADYLEFFTRKFHEEGWQTVVHRYMLSKTKLADEMLVRLFAGLVHPLIHFGFGVEFEQPGIIAEAMAQTAVHLRCFAPYLLGSEKLASGTQSKPLINIFQEIRQDPSLYDLSYWDGGSTLDDNVLGNAPPRLTELAAQWQVSPNEHDLDQATAEMINVNAWVTACAQRPPKEVKLDFFLIHQVNAAIFFSAFNKQSWLTVEDKVRLVEWKGRLDLITYASRIAPELHENELADYKPRVPDQASWSALVSRANRIEDDGHISKLLRALAHGQAISGPYENQPGLSHRFPLKGDGWLTLANMAVDTTDSVPYLDRWVRGAGADLPWDKFVNRGERVDDGKRYGLKGVLQA